MSFLCFGHCLKKPAMLNREETQIKIDRELSKQSFRSFVQIAFNQIDPLGDGLRE